MKALPLLLLLLAVPAHARVWAATTNATFLSALSGAATGDTILAVPGSYSVFPNPSREGVYCLGYGASVSGGQLNRKRTTLRGFAFRGSLSVWADGCSVLDCTGSMSSFNLDNWAGVADVTLIGNDFAIRNPGSTAFLMRWQPEGDGRIRNLRVERNRFVMTLLPGQPTEQKVLMWNRTVGALSRGNLYLFRDSTGQDVGTSVRQGFLVRDGISGCLWEGDTIRALALLNGRGNVGIDLLSSGNGLPGGSNTWRGCVIENETSAPTQLQWRMQPGDLIENCRIFSRTGFRISGVSGTARFIGNKVKSTGTGVGLTLGGTANTNGTLIVQFNQVSSVGSQRSGIAYDMPTTSLRSDWNYFLVCTMGQEVVISNQRRSLATACAAGFGDCHSKGIYTKPPITP